MLLRTAILLATLAIASAGHAQEAASLPPPAAEPPPLPPVYVPPPPPPEPPAAIVTTPAGHLRVLATPRQITRWRRARIVSAFGTFTGVAGLGLSLSSVIYVAVTDYPPSANDVLAPSAKPTDVGPMLAYTGASLSTVSFVLTAAGLGAEHSVLRHLGVDTDRGRFGAGIALGVIGSLSTGMSYFFGSTNHLDPHDQGVAILATSISGTALCALASILFLTDSSRMKKNWKTYVTF